MHTLNNRPTWLSPTLTAFLGTILALGSCSVSAQDVTAATIATMDIIPVSAWKLPDPQHPQFNPYDKKRAILGKKLFFDPRLSANGKMSCATCHNISKGWSDGRATALGPDGKVLARATPSLYNVAYSTYLMWDGRVGALERQVMDHITDPEIMGNNHKDLLKTLRDVPEYQQAFEQAYPGIGITRTTIERSLAVFQRTIISRNSPFDQWVAGDEKVMNPSAKRGYVIFVSLDKGNCASCHQPPNFTDNGFHNIGLASYGNEKPDLGRFNQDAAPAAKGAFKTPQLRNITETAPYFHDGSAARLDAVVRHYVNGGVNKTNLSPNMRTGKLTEQEIKELVAFLRTLSWPD